MSDKESAHREFTVQPYLDSRWTFVSYPYPTKENDFDGIHPKLLHLVERAAYDQLKQELDGIKLDNDHLQLIKSDYLKNIISIKEENQKLCKLVDGLFDQIKHGDEEHQLWLKNKIEQAKKEAGL